MGFKALIHTVSRDDVNNW